MRKGKMRKKLLCGFFMAMAVFLLVACGKEQNQDRQNQNADTETLAIQYLGVSDQKLVKDKGKGVENTSTVDGEEVILSRVYREKFLGFDSELTVMLSSDGTVEYMLYSLNGEKDAVVAAINQYLDKEKPDEVSDGDTAIGYKAIWRQEPYIYTMIAEENQIGIAVIKE